MSARATTLRRAALRFTFLALAGTLAAGAVADEPELESVRFENLSIEDGLSSFRITDVYQDSTGFLWVATHDGLNRYDGYGFQVFRNDPGNPDSLVDSQVTSIVEDPEGMFWVATQGSGLDRFDPDTRHFEHFRSDPSDPTSLSHDLVWKVIVDRTGDLWAGTYDGLDRFDPGSGGFVHYRPDPDDPRSLSHAVVFDLFEDRQGDLWIGTADGLNRFDRTDGGFRRYLHDPDDPRSLSHGEVNGVREDAAGRLWVGTKEGLNLFQPATGDFVRYLHDPADETSLASDEIYTLAADPTGKLWIATPTRGLDRLDPVTGVFRHYRHNSGDPASLPHDQVAELFVDRTGILWIGTAHGLSKYDRRREQFTVWAHRPGAASTLASSSIRGVVEDRSGALWIGTAAHGLHRLGPERRVLEHFEPDPDDPGSLPHATISSLLEDHRGTIWVATVGGGLNRFDPKSRGFVRIPLEPDDPDGPSNNYVMSLLEDRAERLWVTTAQGLFVLDRDRRTVSRRDFAGGPEGLGRTWFRALCEDRSGFLWIGSQSLGLYRIEPDGDGLEAYRHDPTKPGSLGSDKVEVIFESRAGELWVGTTGGGLNRLDPENGRFTRYLEQDGLASNQVLEVLEDETGALWVATSRGLSRLDPESGTFRNYDVADGLPGLTFARRSALKGHDGTLFFGSDHGLVSFVPERLEEDPRPPPVAITELRVHDRVVPLSRSLRAGEAEVVLGHQDDVSFEFAALHFAQPRAHEYAYRLEGFDATWVKTDASRRFARYSNLPPGSYVFRVRGSNCDGVWNDDGASLRLAVRAPPWRTWWAYVGYIAAVAALVFGLGQVQKRRAAGERAAEHAIRRDLEEGVAERTVRIEALMEDLRAQNAELESFTYTVSHDLKSPLVTISGFLGFLEQDTARGDAEHVARDVEHIRGAVGKMQRLIDDLLELARIGRQAGPTEVVAMKELVDEVTGLLAGELEGVELAVAPDLPEVRGERTQLRQVMQNLVANAARYMGGEEAPRIEVGWTREGGETVFEVRDNGLGIDPRHHEQIFGLFQRLDADSEGTGVGLALVKKVVELHGGRVWVESEGQGKGSCFRFTLP